MTDAPSPRCSSGTDGLPFQKRVVEWLMACFSMEVCRDGIERNHRFLEEALELVQSLECTRSEAHQLVDYVFDRPVGEPMQELGGALVTLTALANCHDMDLMQAGETELARVWTKIAKIRAKQAAKPKHSPLPQHVGVAQAAPEPVRAGTFIDVREMVVNNRFHWCIIRIVPKIETILQDFGPGLDGMRAADGAIKELKSSSVSSTNSCSAATKHSGTFLGYRDEHGNEMHCAHAFCPHQAKCRKGCINPVAVTSTNGGSGK